MATQLPSCAAVAGEHTELGVEHGVDRFPRRAAYMDGGALGRPILRGDVALWHGAPHRDGQRLVDAGARVCETRRGGIERERDIWGGDGNWGRNTPVTPTAVPQQCHNTRPHARVCPIVCGGGLPFPKSLTSAGTEQLCWPRQRCSATSVTRVAFAMHWPGPGMAPAALQCPSASLKTRVKPKSKDVNRA